VPVRGRRLSAGCSWQTLGIIVCMRKSLCPPQAKRAQQGDEEDAGGVEQPLPQMERGVQVPHPLPRCAMLNPKT